MNDKFTSAQFHILSELMIYGGGVGLIDKDPTNDYSSTIRLPNLIPHLEMLLSLSQINPTLITEKEKGTPLIHDLARLGELYHS